MKIKTKVLNITPLICYAIALYLAVQTLDSECTEEEINRLSTRIKLLELCAKESVEKETINE